VSIDQSVRKQRLESIGIAEFLRIIGGDDDLDIPGINFSWASALDVMKAGRRVGVVGKRIDVVPEGSVMAAAAGPSEPELELPEVPQLVAVPERPSSSKRPKIDTIPLVITAPPEAEARSLVVQRKQYPARGKLPALDVFQEAIPDAIAPLLAEDPQLKKWATKAGKQRITEALCVVHKHMFEANKSEPRSKIAVRKVKQQ